MSAQDKQRKKAKAKLRRDREWPQVERVFSSNFQRQMDASSIKCWVPLEDFRTLERKYLALANRYKRELCKVK